MSQRYQIGTAGYIVQLEPGDNGTFTVTLTPNGDEAPSRPLTRLTARLEHLDGVDYLLVVGENQHLVTLVQGTEDYEIQLGGQRYGALTPELLQRHRRRATKREEHGHITPPMPGQVTKILVAEGEQVKRGQALLVISAMKMETSLTAPYAGMVKQVKTSVGAQVNPGEVLVDIEEEA